MRLKDKVAIVTGTSSGIGIGIAEVFAEEGAKVVGVARRTQEGESVMQAIRDRGGEAIFVQADVADENDVTAMVASALEAFGHVDVLVNNAGVNFVKPFE
jgi:NAD(P)-dependent dehydrogenase (short-subunit alcohol dehydrogenase family)